MQIKFDIKASDAKIILFALLLLDSILLILHLIDYATNSSSWLIHNMFNLDAESNFPTWYSTVQLLFVGIISLVIKSQNETTNRPSSLFFLIFGLSFVYLSLDEASRMHEYIIPAILKHFSWAPHFKGNHGLWISLYLAIGVLFCLVFWRDLKALWSNFHDESLVIILGIIIFLTGVCGLEIINYELLETNRLHPYYQFQVACEEFLEMVGVSIILYGTLLLAMRRDLLGENPGYR